MANSTFLAHLSGEPSIPRRGSTYVSQEQRKILQASTLLSVFAVAFEKPWQPDILSAKIEPLGCQMPCWIMLHMWRERSCCQTLWFCPLTPSQHPIHS